MVDIHQWSSPLANLTAQLVSLGALNGKEQNSKNRQIVSFFPTFYKSCSWDRSSNDFSTIWDPRSRTNRVLILLFLNRSQRGGNLFSRGNFWLQIKSVGTNQRPSLTKECLRRKRGGGIFNIHTRFFSVSSFCKKYLGMVFQYWNIPTCDMCF